MSNKKKSQPNIIYILGDDQRADYLGIAGHPVLKTPSLDQLAKDGVYFSNAFCTSPACTPSRCCHYLGQWERTHGVNFNSDSSISPNAWENSFPMLLKKAGYYTGWVGKNHVPAGDGGYKSGFFENDIFDYWYGNHGHSGFYPKEFSADGSIYNNAKYDTQVEVFEEGVMNFLDPDQDFLDSCETPLPTRPQDKPFCLCITFNLPHSYGTGTMQLRPEDDELYKSTYRDQFNAMPQPETYVAYSERKPRLPLEVYDGHYIPSYDFVKAPMFLKERQVRYCQTITGMDRMVGNLRKKLKELNLVDNTIIVFSTDHGLHFGEHGLGGKCFLYEEDIRIPLIIYDPRQSNNASGQTRDEFALVPDLAPTVLEMAGMEIPPTMQGTSLVPLIKGEEIPWRTEIFTEQLMDIQNYPRSESVRSKEWKYIRYFKRTEDPEQEGMPYRGTLDNYIECLSSSLTGEAPIYEELFDLCNDPHEKHNIAQDAEYSAVLERFRAKTTELGLEVLPENSIPDTLPL
jgi:arylsulfatase A-like enzyme